MSLYEMRNTVAGRVAGTLAAFALVLSLSFGGALNAQAQTEQELRDQIAQLTALIAQLQAQVGGSTSTPSTGDFNYTFTRNLTIGATGQDVLMLQKYLNRIAATQVAAVGAAGGPGTETSYYGPATGAAVKRYQELHRAEILAPLGLTAGTVNFGSSTRAFMNAEIAAGGSTTPGTPGTPGTGGDLKGGEGILEVYDLSGDASVNTGDTDVVYEFEVEAVDSDVAINRIDFVFNGRPWLLFDEVNLLVDGKEVGSLARERDYTRSGSDWRARFTGLDIVVREGNSVTFELEATAVSALRGSSTTETINVYLPELGVRGVDALGLVIYNEDGDLSTSTVTVDSNYGAGDLRIRKSSNSPKASTFETEDTAVVARFDVDARKGDMTLYTVEVTPALGGGATLRSLRLIEGSSTYTGRVSGGVYTFDFGRNGVSVREGRSVNFELEAVFNHAGTFQVGDVKVSGENVDYQSKSITETFTEGHTVVDENAAVITKVSSAYNPPVYASDGTTVVTQGSLILTFKVEAGDVDVTVATAGTGSAADKKVVYAAKGVSGNLAAALYDEDENAVSSDINVLAGTSQEFTLVYSFDSASNFPTPELEITNVDENPVSGIKVAK